MANIVVINTVVHGEKRSLLVQKTHGFFEKEGCFVFIFEHKPEQYVSERLERSMNKQLFYMEEMLSKQLKYN